MAPDLFPPVGVQDFAIAARIGRIRSARSGHYRCIDLRLPFLGLPILALALLLLL
jgi:hypothetical protein